MKQMVMASVYGVTFVGASVQASALPSSHCCCRPARSAATAMDLSLFL
jgi:hypothetical protein